jgi:hypothetical protein
VITSLFVGDLPTFVRVRPQITLTGQLTVTYFGADSAAGPDSYLKERLSLFLMEK